MISKDFGEETKMTTTSNLGVEFTQINKLRTISINMAEVPPSVNHIWKHTARGKFVRCYVTQKGRDFKEALAKQVPEDFPIIKGSCKMNLILTFPDKRRRDIDNYSKGILDALSGKVYEDDSQIMKLYIEKRYEARKPMIEIDIEEIGFDGFFKKVDEAIESNEELKKRMLTPINKQEQGN